MKHAQTYSYISLSATVLFDIAFTIIIIIIIIIISSSSSSIQVLKNVIAHCLWQMQDESWETNFQNKSIIFHVSVYAFVCVCVCVHSTTPQGLPCHLLDKGAGRSSEVERLLMVRSFMGWTH